MLLFRLLLDLIPGTIFRHTLTSKEQSPYSPALISHTKNFLIDGFPRSANTSSYYYFQLAIPEAQIAHHIHSWQQFLFARLFGVKSILLIRDPDQSIASLATKRKLSVALCYLEYALLNYFSLKLADYILDFKEIIDRDTLEKFSQNLANELKLKWAPVTDDDVQNLIKTRTAHKNKKTLALDISTFTKLEQCCRQLALHIYQTKNRKASQ